MSCQARAKCTPEAPPCWRARAGRPCRSGSSGLSRFDRRLTLTERFGLSARLTRPRPRRSRSRCPWRGQRTQSRPARRSSCLRMRVCVCSGALARVGVGDGQGVACGRGALARGASRCGPPPDAGAGVHLIPPHAACHPVPGAVSLPPTPLQPSRRLTLVAEGVVHAQHALAGDDAGDGAGDGLHRLAEGLIVAAEGGGGGRGAGGGYLSGVGFSGPRRPGSGVGWLPSRSWAAGRREGQAWVLTDLMPLRVKRRNRDSTTPCTPPRITQRSP